MRVSGAVGRGKQASMPHLLSSGLPKDFLCSCLLLLLREREAHGYELMELVDAFGFDHSDPGALYRSLRRLESGGLVRSRWRRSEGAPRKRVYKLTQAGKAELDRRATDLAAGERAVDAFLDRYLRARQLSAADGNGRAMVAHHTAHRAALRSRPPLGPV